MTHTEAGTPGRLNVALIGTGGMMRAHLSQIVAEGSAAVTATCDPAPAAAASIAAALQAAGREVPPHYADLDSLLAAEAGKLDAVVIVTPHSLHHEQTVRCLRAGLDVMLEKPMVTNEADARDLIAERDRSGRTLVIAFQGSLSAQIRRAATMLRDRELGDVLSISGVVWQNWAELAKNTWRTQPALSGGGFLFDTGAHMLNTVADLAGEDFAEVGAWLDNRGYEVEVMGVAMGRLRGGALVTIHGAGDTTGIGSEIRVFCSKGVLITGQWGERLAVQRAGKRARAVTLPSTPSPWEQFLAVRAGRIANPSPAEVGLRMVRLWDAMNESARNGGQLVRLKAD